MSGDPLFLLGGTFDPVHYGHLRLADDVARAFEPAEVRLLPASDPPHRGPPQASSRQRLAMLERARAEFPRLTIEAREIERPGKSYTVLTLEELRREFGDRPLGLILGADALLGLPTWHRWRDLFGLAHLIVAARPGVTLAIDAFPPHLRDEWEARFAADRSVVRQRPAGAIVEASVTPQAISSSEVRGLLASGAMGEARELLPSAVLAYIESNRLYSP